MKNRFTGMRFVVVVAFVAFATLSVLSAAGADAFSKRGDSSWQLGPVCTKGDRQHDCCCAPRMLLPVTKTAWTTVSTSVKGTYTSVKKVTVATVTKTITTSKVANKRGLVLSSEGRIDVGRLSPEEGISSPVGPLLAKRNLCPICPANAGVISPYSSARTNLAQACCPARKLKTVTRKRIWTKTIATATVTTLVKVTATVTSTRMFQTLSGLLWTDSNGDGVYTSGIDKLYPNLDIVLLKATSVTSRLGERAINVLARGRTTANSTYTIANVPAAAGDQIAIAASSNQSAILQTGVVTNQGVVEPINSNSSAASTTINSKSVPTTKKGAAVPTTAKGGAGAVTTARIVQTTKAAVVKTTKAAVIKTTKAPPPTTTKKVTSTKTVTSTSQTRTKTSTSESQTTTLPPETSSTTRTATTTTCAIPADQYRGDTWPWITSGGDPNTTSAWLSVAADKDACNKIRAVGYYQGTGVKVGNVTLPASTGKSGVYALFSCSGEVLTVKTGNPANNDSSGDVIFVDVAINTDSSPVTSFIAGYITTNGNYSIDTINLKLNESDKTSFVFSVDEDTGYASSLVTQFGGNGTQTTIRSLAFDPSSYSTVYYYGSFAGTLTVSGNTFTSRGNKSVDCFLFRYDASGANFTRGTAFGSALEENCDSNMIVYWQADVSAYIPAVAGSFVGRTFYPPSNDTPIEIGNMDTYGGSTNGFILGIAMESAPHTVYKNHICHSCVGSGKYNHVSSIAEANGFIYFTGTFKMITGIEGQGNWVSVSGSGGKTMFYGHTQTVSPYASYINSRGATGEDYGRGIAFHEGVVFVVGDLSSSFFTQTYSQYPQANTTDNKFSTSTLLKFSNLTDDLSGDPAQNVMGLYQDQIGHFYEYLSPDGVFDHTYAIAVSPINSTFVAIFLAGSFQSSFGAGQLCPYVNTTNSGAAAGGPLSNDLGILRLGAYLESGDRAKENFFVGGSWCP